MLPSLHKHCNWYWLGLILVELALFSCAAGENFDISVPIAKSYIFLYIAKNSGSAKLGIARNERGGKNLFLGRVQESKHLKGPHRNV